MIEQRKLVLIKRNLSKFWVFVSEGSKQSLVVKAAQGLFIQAFTSRFFNSSDKVVSQPTGSGRASITWETCLLLLGGEIGEGFLAPYVPSIQNN